MHYVPLTDADQIAVQPRRIGVRAYLLQTLHDISLLPRVLLLPPPWRGLPTSRFSEARSGGTRRLSLCGGSRVPLALFTLQ